METFLRPLNVLPPSLLTRVMVGATRTEPLDAKAVDG